LWPIGPNTRGLENIAQGYDTLRRGCQLSRTPSAVPRMWRGAVYLDGYGYWPTRQV